MPDDHLTELEWEIYGRLGYAASRREFVDQLGEVLALVGNDAEPADYLLLGELCRKWNLGQTAAQCYFKAVVRCAHIAGPAEKIGQVCSAANEALALAQRDSASLSSIASIAIYSASCARLSLLADRFDDLECRSWFAQAWGALKTRDAAAFQKCVIFVDGQNTAEGLDDSLKEEFWVFRHYLAPAMKLQDRVRLRTHRSTRLWFSPLILAILVLCAALLCDLRGWFQTVSLGAAAPTAVIASLLAVWPVLLILTWLYARAVSIRKQVYDHISPLHYMGNPAPVTFGEIMPFRRDHFFHIFQFVWILFLVFAAMIFELFARLPDALATLWNPANSLKLSAGQYYASVLKPLPDSMLLQLWRPAAGNGLGGGHPNLAEMLHATFWNETFAITVAIVVAAYFLWSQYRIQRQRIRTGLNFYWWDWRVNKREWLVRWLMVGLDTFLMAYVLVKLIAVLFVIYDLSAGDLLRINYFHPDGAGGLEYLQDLISRFFLLVVVFGFFFMASLYLHRGLPEYRRSNTAFVLSYGALSFVLSLPLAMLQQKIYHARELVFASPDVSALKQAASATSLQALQALHDWHVSVVGLNYLSAPFFLLAIQLSVQIGFIVWQNRSRNRPGAENL